MDDQRFDRISRVVASSTSRRGALKGIAAALGGGALVSLFGARPRGAAAQGTIGVGEACGGDDECITGLCSARTPSGPGVCYCRIPTDPFAYCDEPEPVCSELGGDCEGDDDCCGDLVCGDGICQEPAPVCSELGGDCYDDDDCCGYLICDKHGVCVKKEEPEPVCREYGEACYDDFNCCGDLVCGKHDVCTKKHHRPDEPEKPEKPKGGGTVAVTTLPSTGSGSEANETAPWLGAAALAGAAAVAANKLRKQSEPQAQGED